MDVRIVGETDGPFRDYYFEDQAYLLSALGQAGPRLAYAHAAGLIMRHDKEAFAGQSMEAARIGKLIGDDVRILVFSAYLVALGKSGLDAAGVLGPEEALEILRPLLAEYLSSVVRGFEWYVTRGEAVPRDQFGPHPWFSAREGIGAGHAERR